MIQTYTLTTPRGQSAKIAAREQTSDLATAGSVFEGVAGSGLVDEYHLQALHLRGVFLDIGAHIGTVTMAVLLDNPETRAICVEPLAENVAMIEANAAENGLAERVTVLHAAVGTSRMFYGPDGDSRYIGNIGGATQPAPDVPSISLDVLVAMAGDDVAAVKVDCEGCEWSLLADPAVADIPLIFGEYHSGSPDRLHALLDATHEVTVTETAAAFGLFRAVRR